MPIDALQRSVGSISRRRRHQKICRPTVLNAGQAHASCCPGDAITLGQTNRERVAALAGGARQDERPRQAGGILLPHERSD